MGKNWHDKFMEIDGTPALRAAEALSNRLEDLKTRLRDAEAEREGLIAQAPAVLAAHEESLLGGEEAQAQAQADLEALNAAIMSCEKKIQVVRDTLSRARMSPEIGRLAHDLWDLTVGFRAALIEVFPEALKELSQAQETYLKVVRRVGEVGTVIARMEFVMNKAASPFMIEPRYQPATQIPAIFLAPEVVLEAYDPNRTLAPIGINPDVLNQPQADADSALMVLKGES